MVDIAKCSNKNCPKHDNCFRFKSTPSQWQTYIVIQNIDNCQMYWPIKMMKNLIN